MPTVKFAKQNLKVQTNSCNNLRKLARANGVQIYHGIHTVVNCHGLGLCGTCVVEVDKMDAVSPKKRSEDKVLTAKKQNGTNRRLACQTLIYKNVTVTTLD